MSEGEAGDKVALAATRLWWLLWSAANPPPAPLPSSASVVRNRKKYKTPISWWNKQTSGWNNQQQEQLLVLHTDSHRWTVGSLIRPNVQAGWPSAQTSTCRRGLRTWSWQLVHVSFVQLDFNQPITDYYHGHKCSACLFERDLLNLNHPICLSRWAASVVCI